jgi:hypothetical protein
MLSEKKIEDQRGIGLVLQNGSLRMIEIMNMREIKNMREKSLEQKMWDVTMKKEGILMIEKWDENGLGTVIVHDLETMIVTVKGVGTVTVIGTGKTGTSIWIIIDTKTVRHSTMMSGRGVGHQGLAANHDYQHMRRNTILEKILIMERGGGLPLNNIVCCLLYLSIFVE